MLVSVVAPVLLREKEYKDLAGRFYGRILARFYMVALSLLMLKIVLGGLKLMDIVLLSLLLLSYSLSLYMKKEKRKLGNIDLISVHHPMRVRFRRLSYLSLSLFLLQFFVAMYHLFHTVNEHKAGEIAPAGYILSLKGAIQIARHRTEYVRSERCACKTTG